MKTGNGNTNRNTESLYLDKQIELSLETASRNMEILRASMKYKNALDQANAEFEKSLQSIIEPKSKPHVLEDNGPSVQEIVAEYNRKNGK